MSLSLWTLVTLVGASPPPEEPSRVETSTHADLIESAETSSVATSSIAPAAAPPPEEPLGPGQVPAQAPGVRHLPPVQIETGDGALRIGLATQLRFEARWNEDANGDRDGEASLQLRRLRTTLSGLFLDDRLSFAFQLNTTPGAFELVDMWIDYAITPIIRVRAGQMKIPLTQYRLLSFTRLPLADWSQSTRWFGGERQLGFMAHNTGRPGGLRYWLGLYTGQNRRAAHSVALSETYGEPLTNDSSVTGFGVIDEFHPELVAMIAYVRPGFGQWTFTDDSPEPLRYGITLSGAADFSPTPTEDMAGRVATELWLKARGFTALIIGYLGVIETYETETLALGAWGFNIESAYRIGPVLELGARYSVTWLSSELQTDARTRADGLIMGADDLDEQARLGAQYADAGRVTKDDELTLGLGILILGDTLKWQTDGSWLHKERNDGPSRDDFRIRSHIQMAF